MHHSKQNWSWTFNLTVWKLVSDKFTGKEMVNMYVFANEPFKTELVMDFKFNSTKAGECQIYWEWNDELCRFAKVLFKIELVMDFQFNSSEAGKCLVYWERNGKHVTFKTEVVMDFQFISTEAGKCHVYWVGNGKYVRLCQFTIQDRTSHGLSV